MKIKTRKNICSLIGIVSGFFALGTIGAIEKFSITLKFGIIQLMVLLLISVSAFYKCGYFKR